MNAVVKPWTRHYYGYIITLLSIIYIIDEVTSSIPGTVQSSIVNEFFVTARGMSYNTGLASFGAISSAFMVITVLAPFYKSLSDRFGRKPFLAINTAGMGLGLLICYTSTTLVLYLIGLAISVFFVAHDMQVVYIMEIAPPKWRGTMYASIKCVASLGVVLIPLLRSLTMGNDPTLWRSVYLVPGLLGLLFGLVTLLTAKETPYFLKHRPAFREQGGAGGDLGEKGERTDQKSGVIPAFKFMFAHRQLRWLSITNLIFFAAAAAIGYYESIMSRGGMSTAQVTQALFVFPFINAGITLANGFMADGLGRKNTAVLMGATSLASFILFIAGISGGWPAYLIGGFYGGYVGSFYAAGDIIGGIMCGESAPTGLRASVIAAQTLILGFSLVLSTAMLLVGMLLVENLGYLCLGLMAPFMAASLVILKLKVGDTRGLDLSAVTGEEWD